MGLAGLMFAVKLTRQRVSVACAIQMAILAAMLPLPAFGAKAAKPLEKASVSALMVSDIHFDPFLDPAKTIRLGRAPAADWAKILLAAPSADRDARHVAVEKACPTRGEDTSFALLRSSLQAMRREAAGARFATVSGDLLAHSYQCKFNAVFPHAAPGDYRAFVEKTLTFWWNSCGRRCPVRRFMRL